MIISIRGTNGAGKSTVVRKITEKMGHVCTIRYPEDPNKRRPCGNIYQIDGWRKLFVPGHYQIDNGGVDTLPSLSYAYQLVLAHHELGSDVLMEGKNYTESPEWLLKLHEKKLDVRVALIDLPVEECVAAVRQRGHKIQEKTIQELHAKSRRQFTIFQQAGIFVFRGGRSQVLAEVRKWLVI